MSRFMVTAHYDQPTEPGPSFFSSDHLPSALFPAIPVSISHNDIDRIWAGAPLVQQTLPDDEPPIDFSTRLPSPSWSYRQHTAFVTSRLWQQLRTAYARLRWT